SERLDLEKKRLGEINMESEVQGRISVLSFGDRPVEADTDRRIPLAGLGGIGGMALGFGIVMLWGLREAQLRHLIDVDGDIQTQRRLLGVVPDMTEPALPGTEPRQAAEMTDYCVHQI